MKLFFTSLFFLYLLFAQAQNVDVSILSFKDYYRGQEPEWQTCNTDSMFFKADTLVFTTMHSQPCDYFTMRIRGKYIRETYQGTNTEPPAVIISNKPITGWVQKRKEEYEMAFFYDGAVWKKFRILELTEIKFIDTKGYPSSYYSMTLVKI